jgi:hypothetical protein
MELGGSLCDGGGRGGGRGAPVKSQKLKVERWGALRRGRLTVAVDGGCPRSAWREYAMGLSGALSPMLL